MARPYEGKLAIVTGASRGIGAGVAKRLAAKGSNVLVTFTSESSKDLAQEIVEELKSKHKIHSQSIQTDLTQATNAAAVIVEAAKSLFHSYNPQGKFQVDILINNAGVSSNQLLNDPKKGAITEAEFTRVYAVNVLAPLILTQTLAPFLPTDRSGRIVNVSSVSSSIGYLGQSVYAGSKGALEVMTRTWARELSERATVNSVNPGPVWGDMYAEAGPAFWSTNQPFVDVAPLTAYNGEAKVLEQVGEDADKFDKLVRGGMGGRRPGFVDEVAGTIDMLCTEESGWTTGSVVCANGGMRMNLA